MIVLHADDVFQEHDTGPGHPECAARARVIARALARHPAISRVETATALARPDDLALVHDTGYLAALETAVREGRNLDADTAVSPRSHEVALKAAGAVVRATDEAISGEARLSFCVVRPPGHHARPARAMGFCLLNNVAVAAAAAVERAGVSRVAVVDFDVHHGNGTQEMFWRDGRVLYVSLHRYPFYPGTGAADETGEGEGKGTTANFPLRAGAGSARYRAAFERAMERCRDFGADVIIASAGFDAYGRDPVGGLGLEVEDYEWIGRQLRATADSVAGGRLVSALEGGYAVEALPELVSAYVTGVANGHHQGVSSPQEKVGAPGLGGPGGPNGGSSMTTRMSIGHAAAGGDGRAMGVAAATEAREKLGGDALLGVVFATSKTDLNGLAKGVGSVLGATPVIGCSTAGEFVTDRVSNGGVAVALIGSDEMGLAIGMGEGLRANTPRAVQQLCANLKKNRKTAPAGANQKTILMLSDGMAGNGEGLVDALAMEAGAGVTIAGGAAGDDALFKETWVFLNDRVVKDAVVAAELTTKKKIGVGVFHGWCAASAPGTVTKAEGGKLIAIDGKPAIDFYRTYAKKMGVELTKENQNAFVFTHELGIMLMNNELKVRAPLNVNDDGSINCATEVPEGKQVRIVEGDHDQIIAAARTAAENAMQGLGGQPPAGAIVFDCVARKLVLDARFRAEVDAFRDVVKAPIMGFNTYGEIARVRGQLSGFHNTTAVVAVLPA